MSKQPLQLAAVIMAGGAGTRFWPLSTEERPKQFLTLFGGRSLLQQSFGRLEGLVPPERILVATSERYAGLVREQIPRLPADNIIGEPLRRDTAAAVALTALLCRERFGDPVICVLTADHTISPAGEFRRELLSAAGAASGSGALYTFGIPPAYPATCYGYLEQGELLLEDNGIRHFRLLRFKDATGQVRGLELKFVEQAKAASAGGAEPGAPAGGGAASGGVPMGWSPDGKQKPLDVLIAERRARRAAAIAAARAEQQSRAGKK
mgnify:CR=1 FL=1